MNEKEYLNVKEVSIKTQQSTRNVRRIITKLEDEVNKELLYKNQNGQWEVHHLILNKFKPQRIHENKYYALSFDPCTNYSVKEIDDIMKFVIAQMKETDIELNYVVESKIANGQNHLHCFVKCQNKQKLIRCIRLAFSQVSYHQSGVFDLQGWKNYITKENKTITTLKNRKND
ncbi:MAG: hypothetical protein K0R65_1536 [Crocinitomicaceae bacterium]|jgi:hypothetical protein|nr:hypothetical protein [Crocinitomicaceae bacterium]